MRQPAIASTGFRAHTAMPVFKCGKPCDIGFIDYSHILMHPLLDIATSLQGDDGSIYHTPPCRAASFRSRHSRLVHPARRFHREAPSLHRSALTTVLHLYRLWSKKRLRAIRWAEWGQTYNSWLEADTRTLISLTHLFSPSTKTRLMPRLPPKRATRANQTRTSLQSFPSQPLRPP